MTLPNTEGNMVQLRVLRSLPHRQEVYSLPDRGVRVYSSDGAVFTLTCWKKKQHTAQIIK